MKKIVFFLVFLFSLSAVAGYAQESKISSTKYREFLVDEAIQLKKSGTSDVTIVDHLYHIGKTHSEDDPDFEGVYGNASLSRDEIKRLKEAGFQDEFIAKFEGHPQYITAGVSAIWLDKSAELTAATMLRIFLKPRSYFKAHKPYWSVKEIWGMHFPKGIIDFSNRWDLNIGYTLSVESTSGDAESNNYLLVGFSHEMNRSVLFNIGYGFVPGDNRREKKQFYLGLTMDSNFLKFLGIVDK